MTGRKPVKIPFLHPKSLGMWTSIVVITSGSFGVYAGFRGCEKESIVREQNIDKVPELVKNYWQLTRRFERDSIEDESFKDDISDSLYDLRAELDRKKNK